VKIIQIYGVASLYAQDIMETCKRLGIEFRSIDNLLFSPFAEIEKLPGPNQKVGSYCIVAPGNPTPRADAVESAWREMRPQFVSLIDPSSVLAESVIIGCGVYINSLVSVGSNTEIMCHANLNRSASVGHDCKIGSYSLLGPGSIVCGSVQVGRETLVGAGAVLLPNIVVGDNCVIGAGSVVTKDVPDGTVCFGNPAKPVGNTQMRSSSVKCPAC
jgi:sugar O-acyltransferase (sialic acid O-acetyltransferase NeuD family)